MYHVFKVISYQRWHRRVDPCTHNHVTVRLARGKCSENGNQDLDRTASLDVDITVKSIQHKFSPHERHDPPPLSGTAPGNRFVKSDTSFYGDCILLSF